MDTNGLRLTTCGQCFKAHTEVGESDETKESPSVVAPVVGVPLMFYHTFCV